MNKELKKNRERNEAEARERSTKLTGADLLPDAVRYHPNPEHVFCKHGTDIRTWTTGGGPCHHCASELFLRQIVCHALGHIQGWDRGYLTNDEGETTRTIYECERCKALFT